MKKNHLLTVLFAFITLASYSQLNVGGLLKGGSKMLGAKISFTQEDSHMRLNYFLNKEEETLPNKTYTFNFQNSDSFLSTCNCKNQIVQSIESYLSQKAPNLSRVNTNTPDILINIDFNLESVLAPSLKSKESGTVTTTGGSVSKIHYNYWVESSYKVNYSVSVSDSGNNIFSGNNSIDFDVKSDNSDSEERAKNDWKNNYQNYINKTVQNYRYSEDVQNLVIEGLKSNIPKPFPRVKELYFAKFSKKDKKEHLFGTSDKHVKNIQNYIKCEINNIYKKCDNFNKEEGTKLLINARDFWNKELQNKYAGSKKKKNLRNGYAFNLLTTSFILKDSETFKYAYSYLENNKYVSKKVGMSRKKMIEAYKKLQEKFLK